MKLTQIALQQLAMDAGIVFMEEMKDYLPREVIHNLNLAMDAQPALVTSSNSGIPAYLANYLDPKLIEVLVAPMRAAQIAGETQKGDWTTASAQFIQIENTGETSSYGDFSENGGSDLNPSFPTRQPYHYQTMTRWGEKQLAIAALAKIDWAAKLNISSALTLNKFQNLTYFYGVSGLANRGLLNDTDLPASGSPINQSGAILWSAKTGDQIYSDIAYLYSLLAVAAQGAVTMDSPMKLCMSPYAQAQMTKTNSFGINVGDLLKKNFPNLTVEVAPEYVAAGAGSTQLVQLICTEVDGQETMTCAFTEKMRAHPIVRGTSSFKQKKSQGSYGCIIFRPVLVQSLAGV